MVKLIDRCGRACGIGVTEVLKGIGAVILDDPDLAEIFAQIGVIELAVLTECVAINAAEYV